MHLAALQSGTSSQRPEQTPGSRPHDCPNPRDSASRCLPLAGRTRGTTQVFSNAVQPSRAILWAMRGCHSSASGSWLSVHAARHLRVGARHPMVEGRSLVSGQSRQLRIPCKRRLPRQNPGLCLRPCRASLWSSAVGSLRASTHGINIQGRRSTTREGPCGCPPAAISSD